MRVKLSEIETYINKGNCTLEKIQEDLGASTICGACRTAILELLGNDVWLSYQLTEKINLNENVCSFRFKPLNGRHIQALPGQHIIIRAKFNSHWMERSYTLTTSPNTQYYEITVKLEPKGAFSPRKNEIFSKINL